MNKYFKLEDLDKQEIPIKKGYEAKLVKDTINGIGFYVFEKTQATIDKEKAIQELEETSKKLIECFEYFLTKVTNLTNINNLSELFKIDDFPFNLKELLKNRKNLKDKISSLEKEINNE